MFTRTSTRHHTYLEDSNILKSSPTCLETFVVFHESHSSHDIIHLLHPHLHIRTTANPQAHHSQTLQSSEEVFRARIKGNMSRITEIICSLSSRQRRNTLHTPHLPQITKTTTHIGKCSQLQVAVCRRIILQLVRKHSALKTSVCLTVSTAYKHSCTQHPPSNTSLQFRNNTCFDLRQ
jgi:hypothetical protein